MGQAENDRNKLLLEGTKSYLDAVRAINQFRRVVQELWREKVEEMIPAISTAMGISVVPDAIKDDVSADFGASVGASYGRWAKLGVKIQGDGDVWTQCYYMEWSEGKVNVVASILFKDKNTAERIYKLLKDAVPRLKAKWPLAWSRKNSEVWIYQELPLTKVDQIDDFMRTAIQQWCDAWKCLGGQKKHIRG